MIITIKLSIFNNFYCIDNYIQIVTLIIYSKGGSEYHKHVHLVSMRHYKIKYQRPVLGRFSVVNARCPVLSV